MNGVRRFLGGGISVSNSSPTDVSSPSTATQQTWSSIQSQSARLDSPEDPKANQGQLSRIEGHKPFQAVEQSPITGSQQSSRPVNGGSTRSQPSVSSISSRHFRSSSPPSGISSPRISSQSQQPFRTSQGLQGRRTLGQLNTRDELLVSLLASEAIVDSRGYELLTAEEVDDLKKELQVLNSRVEAMAKKLALETKIRDAAVSLSKINASNKKVSKQTEEQLEGASRRAETAQKELWRISQRQNEVQRRLLEHRAGVLSHSLRSMERKMANDDVDETDSSSSYISPADSMTSTFIPKTLRFDGAHLFAGHADAQIPTTRRIPGAVEMNALEEKLKAATDALNDAVKRQTEMARELSHLRLEKQEVETIMGMDLQSAEETILSLEKELSRIESLDAQLKDLLQQRAFWEKERTMLTERTQHFEAMEKQLEQRKAEDSFISEAVERHRLELERKNTEIRELTQQLVAERSDWEKEKAILEDEKLEDLTRLQDEVDSLRREDGMTIETMRADVDEAEATLSALVQQHGIGFFSKDYSLRGMLSAVTTHLDNVSSKIASHDQAKDEWEALRKKLEEDIRSGLDKRETLVREIEDARREREDVRRELRLLEARIKEQSSPHNATELRSTPPPPEYSIDVPEYLSVLQSLWAILPSPEARAAKIGTPRQFRAGTPTSPTSNNIKSGSVSLSELDVRSLKLLYDARATPASPSTFSLDEFAGRVHALIADDRALIERLVRFAQAHDLLKKNAERAQKLAQDSNSALETYQKQVRTLEERNLFLTSKQVELQDEIQDLQRAIDRVTAQKRDIEMHAAQQAETCRQLTDANNQLSAKALTLAEEAASAPEKIRKQLEVQLADCQTALQRAEEEIEMLQTSEQSQRIALLDELNLMQTENSNLRAQLRAVRR